MVAGNPSFWGDGTDDQDTYDGNPELACPRCTRRYTSFDHTKPPKCPFVDCGRDDFTYHDARETRLRLDLGGVT
jgi:hypothetical protein